METEVKGRKQLKSNEIQNSDEEIETGPKFSLHPRKGGNKTQEEEESDKCPPSTLVFCK